MTPSGSRTIVRVMEDTDSQRAPRRRDSSSASTGKDGVHFVASETGLPISRRSAGRREVCPPRHLLIRLAAAISKETSFPSAARGLLNLPVDRQCRIQLVCGHNLLIQGLTIKFGSSSSPWQLESLLEIQPKFCWFIIRLPSSHTRT